MKDDDDDEEGISNAKYPCIPSRVALMQMRNRLHLAQLGKKLMKWTALATMKELRKLAAIMLTTYKDYEYSVRNCYILLARCRYFYPQLNTMVAEGLPQYPRKATVYVGTSTRCMTGAKTLQFTVYDNNTDNFDTLAIAQGGQAVQAAKKAWYDLLKLMVLILELKMSFLSIELAHRNATKKSNVLGKIVIPRINFTMKYILDELEERDREEFFRMKKIINVKEKDRKRKKMELDAKEGKVAVPKYSKEVVSKEEPPKPVPPKIVPKEVVIAAPKAEAVKELKPLPMPKLLPPQTPLLPPPSPPPLLPPPKITSPVISVRVVVPKEEQPGPFEPCIEESEPYGPCQTCSESETNVEMPSVIQVAKPSRTQIVISSEVSAGSNQQYYDVETKEITKIIRIIREDGTVIEEVKTIKIVKEIPTSKSTSKLSVSSKKGNK